MQIYYVFVRSLFKWLFTTSVHVGILISNSKNVHVGGAIFSSQLATALATFSEGLKQAKKMSQIICMAPNIFVFVFLQVATLSVFSYFFFSLFGAQYLVPHNAAWTKETFPVLEVPFSKDDPFNKVSISQTKYENFTILHIKTFSIY